MDVHPKCRTLFELHCDTIQKTVPRYIGQIITKTHVLDKEVAHIHRQTDRKTEIFPDNNFINNKKN